MKRTLKRELKVPEIAERESVATNVCLWRRFSGEAGVGRGCARAHHWWAAWLRRARGRTMYSASGGSASVRRGGRIAVG